METPSTQSGDVVFDAATGREFTVGGTDTPLTDEEQFQQLAWYFHQHYPMPDPTPPWRGGTTPADDIDEWFGKLDDRLTHSAMLMLGSAVDHRTPGVAFTVGYHFTLDEVDAPPATVITPDNPSSTWIISAHGGGWWRGSGVARDYQHLPTAAALANVSGCTVIDVDYPLAPAASLEDMVAAITQAVDYARSKGAARVCGWGISAGAALIAACGTSWDAMVLDRPQLILDGLPHHLCGTVTISPANWPHRTLIQRASDDTRVTIPDEIIAAVTTVTYPAEHSIITPTMARTRLTEAADFLRG